MVVKHFIAFKIENTSLRVVLSHMVVKQWKGKKWKKISLRVVLSHMVVKLYFEHTQLNPWFESSVISYGSQTFVR